ncbi:PilZ domain-containing protein [Desulfogranum marinum]|uniref:PilZ domain-containing protein n=1 Tax=Desulfogranum marinum TaxID=453220 RepID=UPI0019645EC4|nr:PilZ domain-containing protein [Desulfogranum marinum]MBM9512121.1 PilZ domain-containing protein [Desulfogranum marinum]
MMSRGQNSWMERTSFASPLVCTECGQRLTSYGLCTISAEQRRHNRFLLPASFLLRIPGDKPQFARIKNISQGGISFDNLSCCLPAHKTLRVDIFNCNTGTGIEQLPVEIVSTPEKIQNETPVAAIQATKGARFLNLTQAQKKLLADCIQTNGKLEEIQPPEELISQ